MAIKINIVAEVVILRCNFICCATCKYSFRVILWNFGETKSMFISALIAMLIG